MTFDCTQLRLREAGHSRFFPALASAGLVLALVFLPTSALAEDQKSQHEENHGIERKVVDEVATPCPDSELAVRQMPAYEAMSQTEDDDARAFVSTVAGHINDLSCIPKTPKPVESVVD